jgi:serine protease Do
MLRSPSFKLKNNTGDALRVRSFGDVSMTRAIVPIESPQTPRPRRPKLARKLVLGVSLAALLAGAALPELAYPTATAAPPVAAGTVLPDFATLVERVKPAVFSVQVKIDPTLKMTQDDDGQQTPSPFQGENPFKGTPFEHFFDGSPFQFRRPPGNDDNGGNERRPLVQAVGSGFFISADGYAITNNHVVDGAATVEVVTDDKKTYKAKIIGTDPKTDLALLKVEDGGSFPYVKMAQQLPKIGEWVLAVGNPFGLGGTVTAGIVSAENRDIGSGPYDDYIQIDAAVNRGNSGGPTFNLNGEVIGVNTAIYSPSGGSVGIAFDIPATTVNQIVPILKEKGHVDRAWLGVQIQPVTSDIAESLGLSEAKGALIARPESGSPADRAGLESGDVIVKVDGKQVADARDLAKTIGSMAPDTKVDLTVVRGGKDQQISVKLGAMKDEGQKQAAVQNRGDDQTADKFDKLGLSVSPASSVRGAGSEGVVVTEVDPSGPAAETGIEPGDVILKIGDSDIKSAKDLRQALSDTSARGRDKALALVKRGNGQRYVALPAKSLS